MFRVHVHDVVFRTARDVPISVGAQPDEVLLVGVAHVRSHARRSGIVSLDVPKLERVIRRRRNQLIADPDTLVIDTRNAYEVAIGTFEGALDPRTNSFRDGSGYSW